MDKLIIKGPCKLEGTVTVSSAKNASLPILASTLLFPGKVHFKKLPKLSDITFFLNILESLGASTQVDAENTTIDCAEITNTHADYELVRKMRASVLVLGPLLSRLGKAEVSLPGGCAIGTRPVDIHLKALEQMGAEIKIEKGYIKASCKKLKGGRIELSFPSVGATENIMMAAVYAEGVTIIENAAREPEIVDHANFLKKMGVNISGEGTSTITIEGTSLDQLVKAPIEYEVIGDRIEAATFIIAALMCDSHVVVKGTNPEYLGEVIKTLERMGAKIKCEGNSIEVFPSGRLKATKVETAPFPGFPTDVQAQLMALMGVADGNSVISEHIFENRFMHVPELMRMGMDIQLDGHTAIITGNSTMTGAPVMCTDLRASAALILGAMAAKGESVINRIYHLDRGYESIEQKLMNLGANIERVKS